MLEIVLGMATELFHVHGLIDHNRGRSVGAQHDAVGDFQKLCGEIGAVARRQCCLGTRKFRTVVGRKIDHLARRGHVSLRVNLVLAVQRLEKFVVQSDRFSRSKNQIAARIERIMKLGDAAFM
jgi:hypothetical protein